MKIVTPLTFDDAVMLARCAAANYPSVVSALMDVDRASREQQKEECAGHIPPFELREFLLRALDYFEDRADVNFHGQANEAMQLQTLTEGFLRALSPRQAALGAVEEVESGR